MAKTGTRMPARRGWMVGIMVNEMDAEGSLSFNGVIQKVADSVPVLTLFLQIDSKRLHLCF
jgi:hypothetical protein